MEDKELKWYYIDYDTFFLENEIEASSEVEAYDIAVQMILDGGVDITVEEMED